MSKRSSGSSHSHSSHAHYSGSSGVTAAGSQYGNGTNSAGNHYCTRGESTAQGGAYHYSNANGSYYYQNANSSNYYANPNTGPFAHHHGQLRVC
jgi:hypothetical protein